MQVYWQAGSAAPDGTITPDGYTTYDTYDDAATEAKRNASCGQTSAVYKVVPVARFNAAVTVTEERCEDGIDPFAVTYNHTDGCTGANTTPRGCECGANHQ